MTFTQYLHRTRRSGHRDYGESRCAAELRSCKDRGDGAWRFNSICTDTLPVLHRPRRQPSAPFTACGVGFEGTTRAVQIFSLQAHGPVMSGTPPACGAARRPAGHAT
jgi:hypothetical protein